MENVEGALEYTMGGGGATDSAEGTKRADDEGDGDGGGGITMAGADADVTVTRSGCPTCTGCGPNWRGGGGWMTI